MKELLQYYYFNGESYLEDALYFITEYEKEYKKSGMEGFYKLETEIRVPEEKDMIAVIIILNIAGGLGLDDGLDERNN